MSAAARRADGHRTPHDPAQYKRDRRAAVLAHHPDHGGSADELIAALEEVDRRHGLRPDTAGARKASEMSSEQALAVVATAAAGILALGASVAVTLLSRRR